jgi:hypothetical protein
MIGEFVKVCLEIPFNSVYGVVVTLAAIIVVFMATAYYAFNRRILADMPDALAEHI